MQYLLFKRRLQSVEGSPSLSFYFHSIIGNNCFFGPAMYFTGTGAFPFEKLWDTLDVFRQSNLKQRFHGKPLFYQCFWKCRLLRRILNLYCGLKNRFADCMLIWLVPIWIPGRMFNISIAQISIWTWPNALYNSRGNQINIAQVTIIRILFTNQIKSNVGFWWEGKTGVAGEKPLMTE